MKALKNVLEKKKLLLFIPTKIRGDQEHPVSPFAYIACTAEEQLGFVLKENLLF